MKAIIVHSVSKYKRSLEVAEKFEGDIFFIEHVKKPIRFFPFQLMVYGFQTVANKKVMIKPIDIDLDKYDEFYLVSPVWAGQTNAYMKQFLEDYPLKNKLIHIIGTSLGGYEKFFNEFKKHLDESNKIVEETMYVKGEKQ